MSRNRTEALGRTISPTSSAMISGRRYSDAPSASGTQSTSVRVSSSQAATKSSTGNSGRASRRQESARRWALRSGRNSATPPSGWR
jgi:hypothetical protein